MKPGMRLIVFVVLVVGLVGALFSNAAAITNGTPDGSGHPYVGMVALYGSDGQFLVRCTGSLIAPDVVVTAAHCLELFGHATSARVFFDSDLTDLAAPYTDCGAHLCVTGAPHSNPQFCPACGGGLPGFDTHDTGVIVLDHAVTVLGYASLPASGLTLTLPMKSPIDLVGYGVEFQDGTGMPPFGRWTGPVMRNYAAAELVQSQDATSDEFIKVTANPAQDKGGMCFYDSGGPDFQGGTNIVLAVNSFLTNTNCTGVTYAQRLDLPDELAWINSFVH